MPARLISILFLLKVAAGMCATWYGVENSADLWACYKNSLAETALLKNNPLRFFTSLFESGYDNYDGFYSTRSFWNDLRYTVMDKILGILNLFSFNNVYTDVLIYDAVIFLGHVALYRVFTAVYPQKKWSVLIGCFLLPTSLFFLSTVNKDSLFFLAAAMVCYALYKMPRLNKASIKTGPLLLLITGLGIMFIIRNFFLLAALPAVCCYYGSTFIKIKPVYIFSAVFAAIAVVVLASPDIMALISKRQNEFLTLGPTKSMVAVPSLQPALKNFIAYLPISFSIVFLRPFLWDAYNFYYLVASLETLTYQIILAAAIVTVIKRKKIASPHPLVLFGIFFSITALVIIGYTIPYMGAVIRYKTAFLPFLITPLLCFLPLENFFNYYTKK